MKATLLITILAILITSCGENPPASKNSPQAPANVYPALPQGWSHIDSANAVMLGARQCPRKTADTDYVIIVNLAAGASIKPLDSIYQQNADSPVFYAWHVFDTTNTNFWQLYANQKPFAITNLMFFDYCDGPMPQYDKVCYPLYYDHKFINHTSLNCNCYGDSSLPKRIILFSGPRITVADYKNWDNFKHMLTDSVNLALVGNLPIINGRDSTTCRPRTYLAKEGGNLVVYLSNYATELDIDTTLRNQFQIPDSDIVMFDGGGSTQMVCNGKPYIPSVRYVPSALGIFPHNY